VCKWRKKGVKENLKETLFQKRCIIINGTHVLLFGEKPLSLSLSPSKLSKTQFLWRVNDKGY